MEKEPKDDCEEAHGDDDDEAKETHNDTDLFLGLEGGVVKGGGGGGPSKLRLANDVDLQELVPRLQMLVVLQLRLMRVATPAGA